MANLIKVQFYRLKKYPLSRYLLIPACIAAVLLSFVIYNLFPGSSRFTGIYVVDVLLCDYMFFFCAVIMIPLAYFVCNSFSNKTVTHEIVSGYNIHQILLSRLIAASGITTILSLITVFLFVTIMTLFNGWSEGESFVNAQGMVENITHRTVSEYLYCTLIFVFTVIQASVICVLSSCIARETTSSLAISWMLYLFAFIFETITWSILMTVFHLTTYTYSLSDCILMAILPGLQPKLWFQPDPIIYITKQDSNYLSLADYLPLILLAGTAVMVLFYIIAYQLLKRREIREKL